MSSDTNTTTFHYIDKETTISEGAANEHNDNILEDYLKQKKDGTLHISDFDDFLEEMRDRQELPIRHSISIFLYSHSNPS